MPADLLRIFVSSPGDVGEERVMAQRVIERLQGEFGQSAKLEAILWEHEPMRATQSFQEQIPVPSACDIVVCILWSRLGTRLPRGISAPGKTGTEWEFEDAARSFQQRHIPDLLVYRKTKEPLASLRDEVSFEEKRHQLRALDAFVQRWFQSDDGAFKAAFKTFETLDHFENILETDLRKLIGERLKRSPLPERTWYHEPFRGLETFDYEHAPIFFGRTRAIGAIRDALVQQSARGSAFVLVLGMSGVGKSSLIRAGVLPTITQPGVIEGIGLWRWCLFRPSDAPGDFCAGLAAAMLTPQALPELEADGVSASQLAGLLREAPGQAAIPLRMGLKRAAEAAAAAEHLVSCPEGRLAIAIDQMEEIFSLEKVDAQKRRELMKALEALARSGLAWIIGTMRSDYYPRCAEIPELAALKQGAGQYDLLPPTVPELHQMISYPARAGGLRFEDKADGQRLEDILEEAAASDPQALPLLEFTLAELYKLRTEQNLLTFAAYQQLGGMEGALARRAEAAFAQLPASVQGALPVVIRTLVTVLQEADETVVTQAAPRRVFDAKADQNALIEAFVKARLLVTDRTTAGEPTVRLVHEALLARWPRLQEILAENRDFLRIRARVAEAAARWQREGRLPDLLLPPGKPLAESEFLLARRQEIDAAVLDYIELSRRSATRARHRRQRAVTAFVAVLVVGTILSITFGIAAHINANTAREQKSIADSKAAENLRLAQEREEQRKRAENQRARAQHLALVARDAFIQSVERISHKPLSATLREEKVPARLLEDALGFYRLYQSEVDQDKGRQLESTQVRRWTGDVLQFLGRNDEAGIAYADAEARHTVLETVGSSSAPQRAEHAQLHNNWAILLQEKDNLAESKDKLLRSIQEWRRLVDQFGAEPTYRYRLAVGLTNLADVTVKINTDADVDPFYRESVNLLKELAEGFPGDRRYAYELAETYENWADQLDDSDQQSEHLQKALKLFDELAAKDQSDSDAWDGQSRVRLALGDLFVDSNDLASAEKYYRDGRDLRKKAAEKFRTTVNYEGDVREANENLRSVAFLYEDQAAKYLIRKKWSAAEASGRNAVRLLQELLQERNSLQKLDSDLVQAFIVLGTAYETMGDLDKAEQTYREALTSLAKQPKNQKKPALLTLMVQNRFRELVSNYSTRGDLALTNLDPDALKLYRKAVAILESLKNDFPETDATHVELALAYDRLGRGLNTFAGARQNQGAEARQALADAVAQYRFAELELNMIKKSDSAGENATFEYTRGLMTGRRGICLSNLKDWGPAREALDSAISHFLEAAHLDPSKVTYASSLVEVVLALASTIPLIQADTSLKKPDRDTMTQAYGRDTVKALRGWVKVAYDDKGLPFDPAILDQARQMDAVRTLDDYKSFVSERRKILENKKGK
jgi:tetratricopeptide (TPR) repeat protein